MRSSADFTLTVRRGARAGRTTLVVHCRPAQAAGTHVGFVVARSVGGAVVRNRVKRRLRSVVVDQREKLPVGVDVVVRALPPAAQASYAELSSDLTSALATATRRMKPSA